MQIQLSGWVVCKNNRVLYKYCLKGKFNVAHGTAVGKRKGEITTTLKVLLNN